MCGGGGDDGGWAEVWESEGGGEGRAPCALVRAFTHGRAECVANLPKPIEDCKLVVLVLLCLRASSRRRRGWGWRLFAEDSGCIREDPPVDPIRCGLRKLPQLTVIHKRLIRRRLIRRRLTQAAPIWLPLPTARLRRLLLLLPRLLRIHPSLPFVVLVHIITIVFKPIESSEAVISAAGARSTSRRGGKAVRMTPDGNQLAVTAAPS